MVVQHNLQAMNANRMLNITTTSQSKSTEKLSSGYRINRAADDAAGLSISEKMRKQINGLDQASTNADDGVSAVQTAEGALTEVHSMLQRMNELATQAANGTNSESDREAIQNEIDQLTTEIDRVSETTKFNETYLLKGDTTTSTHNVAAHDAGLAGTLVDNNDGTYTFTADPLGSTVTIGGQSYSLATASNSTVAAANGVTLYDASGAAVTSITETSVADAEAAGTYFTSVTADTTQAIAAGTTAGGTSTYIDTSGASLAYVAGKVLYDANGSEIAEADLTNYFNAAGICQTECYTAIKGDTAATATDFTLQMPDGLISEADAYTKMAAELKQASDIGTDTASQVTDNGDGTFTITQGTVSYKDALSFNLHVGADADMTNKINVEIETMNSAYLGVKNLNVKDGTGNAATYAIDAISDAISKVSAQRSALGAVQNRLEHTINNLDNVVENTTSAESRIRDTDMAEEMVEYSKNNILAQAGQSMLAQANQANQGVLSLLQ
jgi:flagellin